ncbi:uncharacterized protein LOC131597016 [Vicia villosa]|uniref:uncharacterized protein LOC131597016 n=1 Tax=Vicia villosa TaxID=3911 RepID=UPI00273BB404|nr:uncharacterized protein LOC131597016 [Vicia villosa]
MTGVGQAMKSKKLTSHFIGSFEITERVGEVAYRIALPPTLANLHDVFHVSQLRKYVADPSNLIQVDDVQVKDNLKIETLPMKIKDRKLKQLCGKEIALVRVVWGGAAGGNGDIFTTSEVVIDESVYAADTLDIPAAPSTPSIEQPPSPELKQLLGNLKYAYLESNEKHPVVISSNLDIDQENELL